MRINVSIFCQITSFSFGNFLKYFFYNLDNHENVIIMRPCKNGYFVFFYSSEIF